MAGDNIPGSGDSGSFTQQLRFPVLILAVMTGFSMLSILLIGPLGWLLVIGCGFGWAVLLVYILINRSLVNPLGDAIGRILVPTGSSTPSAKGLSHIETMVIRGDYAKAVDAYKHEIATDPADLRSCELLGQLAMKELQDFQLAVWAFKEAERRAPSEKSKVAYGVIAAELYRDKLGEPKRAVVELSRLLATYPDMPNAAALKDELELLKAHIFESP